MQISQYIIVKKTGNWRKMYTSRMSIETPTLKPDEVAVKVTLSLPDVVFTKPALEAKVTVPESAVSQPIINKETIDNVEQIIKQQTGFSVKLEAITEEENE